MDQVRVAAIYARVLAVLIFSAIALVVFIEHIVVVDQSIGCAGEKVEQQLFHLCIEHTFHFFMVVEILALRLAMRERHSQFVHTLGGVRRQTWIIIFDPPGVFQYLGKEQIAKTLIALFITQSLRKVLLRRVCHSAFDETIE